MYIVELQYPGTWLQLADEDKAWEISNLITLMEHQLIDMAITLSLFEEENRKMASDFTYEHAQQQWEQDRELRFEIQSRYIEELGVTPADVLYGRREEILKCRKEVQIQTINRRRDYIQGLRELVNAT